MKKEHFLLIFLLLNEERKYFVCDKGWGLFWRAVFSALYKFFIKVLAFLCVIYILTEVCC